MRPSKARREERRGIARALAAAREAATSLSAVLDVASVARARALAAATEVATPTSVAVAAAIRSTDTKWQQFNDTNLAELARQKALAERRAEEADATLCRVFDGARHAMFTVARLADAAKEGNKLIAKTGEAASKVLRSAAYDGLTLNFDEALNLSEVQAAYEPVASQFKLNEPDVRAAHKFLLQTQRNYLDRK